MLGLFSLCWILGGETEDVQVSLVGGRSQVYVLLPRCTMECCAKVGSLLPHLCKIDLDGAVLIEPREIAEDVGDNLVVFACASVGFRQGNGWKM